MRLKADFVRKNGCFVGCSVTGHAPADADTGISVLCAAVSSAMQLTCNTLTECFGVPEDAVQVEAAENAQNHITIRLPQPDPVQSEILHGLLLHFQMLA
jgi:uncharacterized protein YsxB (DUF464 family)